jgi:hypothetical protein
MLDVVFIILKNGQTGRIIRDFPLRQLLMPSMGYFYDYRADLDNIKLIFSSFFTSTLFPSLTYGCSDSSSKEAGFVSALAPTCEPARR